MAIEGGVSRTSTKDLATTGDPEKPIVVIGDPTNSEALASISEENDPSLEGLVVREASFGKLVEQMNELLIIQKGILKLLEGAFEDGISGREDVNGVL